MSWLARSIANSLRLEEEEEEEEEEEDHIDNVTRNNPQITTYQGTDDLHQQSDTSSPVTPERSVKEDLSDLTKTLTRQFWGVASFLAPPPPQSLQQQSPPESGSSAHSDDPDDSESVGIAGIRSDFAEIGGRFRSGISKLSNNINVSEITKIASNFLQLSVEGDENDSTGTAVGVTREVVTFVRDISAHPLTWLDFPLPADENHEFELSHAQQEHALDVECLVPTLASLKVELCPRYMSEDSFWKIYFVLLHPKLNEYEAELLSTPEIIRARASLMHQLPNQNKADYFHEQESSSGLLSTENQKYVPETSANNFETLKHMIQKDELPIIDKSVVEEENRHTVVVNPLPSSSSRRISEVDDDDDWLKEDSAEIVSSGEHKEEEEDEDISFSDLEEEEGDADITTSSYSKVTSGSDSSTKGSHEWIELS